MTSVLVTIATDLDRVVAELPVEQVPDLLGVLATAAARAQLRLAMPTTMSTTATTNLTAEALAEVFNVPVTQIYEQARQGRIPCVRLGRYVRFSLSAVRQALASGAGTESPALGPRKKRSNGKGVSAPATTSLPDQSAERGPA